MLRKVVVCTFVLCTFLVRADDPTPLPATAVADRAKPATVLIVTRALLSGSSPRAVLDSERLKAGISTMVDEGTLHQYMSETDLALTVLNEVLKSPASYLTRGEGSRSFSAELTYTGSGFIVTPDGYIVTNAHVITADDNDITRALADNIFEWVKEDLAQLNRAIGSVAPGQTMTEEAGERFGEAMARFYVGNMQRAITDQKVYAVIGYARPGQSIDVVGKLCDVKKTGSPIPGKDVAILKIPGRNYPTLPLLDTTESDRVRTGEELHAVGFPSVATFSESLSVSSQLEPSMTNGRVSALKAMTDGWRIIQTDAPLAPGNSGGPVLNDLGQVVGVATFASVDPSTGQQVQGFNFVVPAEVVREFLRDANVTPSESAFTAMYNRGLDEFQRRYYSSALELFRAAGEQTPGLPYVQEHITRCREEIAAGRDETWKKKLWILQVAGAVILLMIVGFGLRLLRMNRTPAVPASPAQ